MDNKTHHLSEQKEPKKETKEPLLKPNPLSKHKLTTKHKPTPKTPHQKITKKLAPKKQTSNQPPKPISKPILFIQKYGFLVLLLIVILLSIYIRIQPLYLPSAENWAQEQVETQFFEQVQQQIKQQQPSLSDEEVTILAAQEYEKQKENFKDSFEKSKKTFALTYRNQFQDEHNQTYLIAIDPHQYYRYAKNIVDHGYMGDILKDGESYDLHMKAPIGKFTGFSFHPYFTAYLYKFLSLFNKDLRLLTVMFLMPLIILTTALIPMFFIGKKFGGSLAGFFAAAFLAVNPSIMSRTMAGFADTDAYSVMFPLFIIWFFIEAIDAKTTKNRNIFLGLATLIMVVFTRTWTGWWITMILLIASTIVYTIYLLFKYEKRIFAVLKQPTTLRNKIKMIFWKEKNIQQPWFCAFFFFVVSIILAILIRGWNGFEYMATMATMPFHYIMNVGAAVKNKAELWPNVYTTVAELNKISYERIIEAIGMLFLVLVLVAIILLIIRYKKRINIFGATMLFFWAVGMLYTTKTGGVRFTMILIPPLALGFGIAVGLVYQLITEKSKGLIPIKQLHLPIKILFGFIIIIGAAYLLGFTITPPFCSDGMCQSSKSMTFTTVPTFDDGWYNTLNKIKQESQPDAIINSWWDFGHWFKAYADRAVIFDGASQNVPQAHWMGRALVTDSEKESLAIFRMLNCGGNTAYDAIYTKERDNYQSIQVLNKLLPLSKEQAEQALLKENFTQEQVDNVTKRLYCNPPETFVVTSGDMVGKAGVWGHFGNWNFERALLWRDVKPLPKEKAMKYMEEELDFTPEKANQTYTTLTNLQDEGDGNSWIATWPSFVSSGVCQEDKNNNAILCGLGFDKDQLVFAIQLDTKDIQFLNTVGTPYPHSITWVDEQGFHQKFFQGETFPYTISLFKDGDTYVVRLMAQELGGSIFNRLFYYDGKGTTSFSKFDTDRSTSTGKIIVWKINWPGG